MNTAENIANKKCDMQYVPFYRSENDNETDHSQKRENLPKKRGRKPKPKPQKEKKPKKTRGKGTNWMFVRKFNNAKEAEEFVRSENSWSTKTNRSTEEGRKQVYRCNKVRHRGPQCIAQIMLLYDAYSDDVILFRNEFEHDHHLIGIRTGYYGIDPETKRAINELFALHLTKPRVVYNHLIEKPGLKMPTIMQLNNYLNDLRRRKYGCAANVSKVKKWIANHARVPDNEHEAFIISFSVQQSSPKICYILSTRKLLEMTSRAVVIYADATYKLHWQGFDIHTVGTSDTCGKFYPLCLAVSNSITVEVFKTLFNGLKDSIMSIYSCYFEPSILVFNNEEVSDAFTTTFGLTPQVRTCYTYTKNEIRTAIPQMDEKKQNAILEDIESLHVTTSSEDFQVAAELFLLKWEEEQDFTNYFREEWLVRHRKWNLGALNSLPTNDAIETLNQELKHSKIIYERLPVKKFLQTTCEIVSEWSQKIISFANKCTVELSEWTEAHNWLKKNRKTTILQSDDDKIIYLVQSGKSPPISRTTYLQSNTSWKTFDEYKDIYFSHWKVTLLKNDQMWMDSKCTCPQYPFKQMCKHIIGLAVQSKYTNIPAEATKLSLAKEKIKVKEESSSDSTSNTETPKSKKDYTLAELARKKSKEKINQDTECTQKNLRKSRLRSEIESALRKEKTVSKRHNTSWSEDSDTPKRKTRTKTSNKPEISISFSSDDWSDPDWNDSSSTDSSRNVDSTIPNKTPKRDSIRKSEKTDSIKKHSGVAESHNKRNNTNSVSTRNDVKNVSNSVEDEFYFFGQSMAAQLRRLPINVALDLQVQFQNELTKARTKCLTVSESVVHSSTNVEKNPLGFEMAILPNKIELDDSE